MKTFDPNIVLELAKEGMRFFLLIELQLVGGTYRYNNSDIDLYSGGNKYAALDFTFDKMETSADMGVDSVNFKFNSANGGITAIILSEDILGQRALLSFICIADDHTIIAAETLFYGLISDWEIAEDQDTIEVQNELILWRKETLRTCQSSCRWEFKGTECTYAGGGSWCDQSYERCSSLANSNNFGGFRFLPAIMEKEIWWGRSPK